MQSSQNQQQQLHLSPSVSSSGFLPNPRKSSHPFLALIYMVLKAGTVALFIVLKLFLPPLTVA